MEKKSFDLKRFIREHRAWVLQGVAAGTLILLFVFLSLWSSSKSAAPALETVQETPAVLEDQAEEEEIFIHVAGEVTSPGLVSLKSGARVSDAIEAAGGLTDRADLSQINLASKCEDGMKIVVGDGADVEEPSEEKGFGPSASLININTADLSSLMELPGIGEVTAKNIIAYREENGSFKTKDEIKQVSRIGEKTYAKIEELICI